VNASGVQLDEILKLAERGILGGLPLTTILPERPDLKDALLFCCTERNDPQAIDELVDAFRR